MTCPKFEHEPVTDEGRLALAVIEQAPRRYGPTGDVVGIEWPAALEIADALGLAPREIAIDYIGAGELGLLEGLASRATDATKPNEAAPHG